MDKSVFAERLGRAAERARDYARMLIVEPLPDSIRFDVELNCSHDGKPLHPDERVYPEDPERIPASSRSRLTREEVVELLWREGAVPRWINLNVTREGGEHTLIDLACCGRFTANEQLLYHKHQGYPPFQALSPPLPSSYEDEKGGRFSLYWHSRVSSQRELATVRERSMHVEILALSGSDLDDEALEAFARAPLPALRHLRLEKTRVQGPGLRPFADLPLSSLSWQADPGLPIDLRVLERFSRLEELEVEVQSSPLGGGSTFSVPRGLRSLHLRVPAFADLGALSSLDSLEGLDLAGSSVKSLEGLTRFRRLDTLQLQRTAVEDEDLRALVGLTRLGTLGLNETAVSDAGLAHLRKLPALRYLELDKTRVSDRGLKHLSRLRLKAVHLRGTQVTEEGVAWLRRECPRLRIFSAFEQYTFPEPGTWGLEGHVRRLWSLLTRGCVA
ncbi:hypothetical protein HPC49_02455 [Pyxidicoccus fallax]|uniref:Uncharacterized protein n=1 Tax=Pyxidicoccus fallax TaxID=394095 RepID=A0A848LH90_9BACT|nr:hypothetical protein [Pyxidicoccus fallax]NMO15708.1 hypothetical protein [Pyxidicoccus fallax]NPC77115.1 hypothetical protein [Pyxidicoccus fallax]